MSTVDCDEGTKNFHYHNLELVGSTGSQTAAIESAILRDLRFEETSNRCSEFFGDQLGHSVETVIKDSLLQLDIWDSASAGGCGGTAPGLLPAPRRWLDDTVF